MQRRASIRVESGLRPKPSGNSAVRRSQTKRPWQCAARLGNPHSEPARLTVSKLPIRPVLRVKCHTLKKAVMAIYRRAGFAQAAVDKRAIGVWQGAGYSRKRVVAKRCSLSRFYFLLPVCPRVRNSSRRLFLFLCLSSGQPHTFILYAGERPAGTTTTDLSPPARCATFLSS